VLPHTPETHAFSTTTTFSYRQQAASSQQAHVATAAGDVARVWEVKAEIGRPAAGLWELTEEELREIQESLEELQ
jgi:hypothetical protein